MREMAIGHVALWFPAVWHLGIGYCGACRWPKGILRPIALMTFMGRPMVSTLYL